MSRPLALGIDVGTSGVRAALVGPGGHVQGISRAAMADHGDTLRSPAVWRRALAAALAGLPALDRVGALSIDATSGTLLALDAAGQPIGDALMYNDRVEDPDVPARIGAVAPRDSAAHGAASGLARAMALQDRPGIQRLAHQADWIAEQITGSPMPSDESNALKTGYDPVARRWPDWIAEAGLRMDLLPQVVPVGAPTGTTSGALGLPPGVATIAGLTDGCASFLATEAAQPGDAVTALGTTLTLKLLSDRPIFAPDHGIYSHRIGEMWLAGGASNSGGAALACHFTPEQIARLSPQIDPEQDSGLDYYPLPAPGERFPVQDPDLAPRVTPRPGSDVAFLHGLLEGIARIEAAGYARLTALGAPEPRVIRTVGGGAQNPTWSAIRRRILGLPEAEAASDEAAVGVARLARAWLDR